MSRFSTLLSTISGVGASAIVSGSQVHRSCSWIPDSSAYAYDNAYFTVLGFYQASTRVLQLVVNSLFAIRCREVVHGLSRNIVYSNR